MNLEDFSFELEDLNVPNQTQRAPPLANILLLFQLPTKKTHDKEQLIDYSNSHVVTSNQYLTILKHKAMDKEVVNKIRELKSKERCEKISKQVENTFTQVKQMVQMHIDEREDKINYNQGCW